MKNLLSTKVPQLEQDVANIRVSSVFAYSWNLIRRRLPAEVLDDFDNFLNEAGIVRMDANSLMRDARGKTLYFANVGDANLMFHGAELAPPTGIFGKNYSR